MSSTIEWEENYNFNGCYTYTIYSTITYELSGGWLRATRNSPAECPDVTVLSVVVDGIENVPCHVDPASLANQYIAGFDFQRDDVRDAILEHEKAGDE